MRKIVVPWLPSAKKGFTTYAITIAPFVFILQKWKDDPGILAHEQVHLDQAKQLGFCRFYWRYVTDLNFRSSVEEAGYAKQREVENA